LFMGLLLALKNLIDKQIAKKEIKNIDSKQAPTNLTEDIA